jgi:pyruvate/2-oxoglutarate/acetoin dehydrogenase E1 component/TPP-dependent pyruvate/acetoin dehydrogenase alpha subunit
VLRSSSALRDYYICCLSREVSRYIRRDVLNGRAKFGVSDDGKELFQVAMAKVFTRGDWRADYYRGHTLLLALELCTPEDLFAQLYADAAHDPFSRGRQMNNHHATPLIDEDGDWYPLTERYNLSSDVSTTAGQVGRGLGLAFASKVYREATEFSDERHSQDGREVCFCCIGDGSTSEGAFWETMNAAAVLQVPLAMTVVDDGYGISVPVTLQTAKGSISAALAGLASDEDTAGIRIYRPKGWNYEELCAAYAEGIRYLREDHEPVLFHVREITQPQGHSTSGSHERYKSKERLHFEKEYDCNRQFRLWLLATDLATEAELEEIEARARDEVRAARRRAWDNLAATGTPWRDRFFRVLDGVAEQNQFAGLAATFRKELAKSAMPLRSEVLRAARRLHFRLGEAASAELNDLIEALTTELGADMSDHLVSDSPRSPLKIAGTPARYTAESPLVNGYEVLNRFFDQALDRIPNLYAFGEDLGKIGGVNQCFAGLQDKYGAHRVFDVGIREWTIVGQAIGMAMRGLRPIAEIQYLDYLLYALSPLADDVATVRWRSANQQQAPLIIRTRGHRLEGIWHSGSYLSILLGALRGIHICVPRNMTQAAGLYNTLLQGDDPGLVIEVLNAYRRKERLPENLADFCVPLGVPERLREGQDLTIVTYGACVPVVEAALDLLADRGITADLIDVQTLWPFDRPGMTGESLQKTNRLLIVDEDVPGGTSAYLLQQILEQQAGYRYLDAPPRTLTATEHRPPYGDDGDYVAKPSADDVLEAILKLLAT